MRRRRLANSVANQVAPLVEALVGDSDALPIRFWDDSSLGPESNSSIVVRSPDAIRRLVWAPGELGLGRAYVSGDIELEGDIFELLSLAHAITQDTSEVVRQRIPVSELPKIIGVALRLGALGLPLPPPKEEAKVGGRLHSKNRDAAAISHHYDVGNDFYALFLGETMTYSCAYFETKDMTLDEAQTAKYDLICRKLGLEPGMRLLDIGCGWGGMAVHAARRYDVRVVGVTLSESQVDLARQRVDQAGLSDQIEIRYQDYRDVDDGPYDAISSIGMFEHVGDARLLDYFERVQSLLKDEGRFLNHAISRPGGEPGIGSRSFIGRYVFPDGELHEVGRVVSSMQNKGLEVRDVESLREHYATTLRHWVANLEKSWDLAVELVGARKARIWKLYMAGSALSFESESISVHQVLGVNPTREGSSGMPSTRHELLQSQHEVSADTSS